MRIILSRTDSIGDVVLTLPMAGVLKQSIPGCTVIFLGRNYTRPVIEACEHIDEFVEWPIRGEGKLPPADIIIHVFPVKEICRAAKRARIPQRIATAGRFFTWTTCNRLIHIPRKNSDLHEAQLNLKMLKALGIDREFTIEEIAGLYGLENAPGIPGPGQPASTEGRKSVILHPGSKGSAREWGLDNFSRLIDLLPAEKYEILVTGTAEEGNLMRSFLDKHRERITDMTGKLSLSELMGLIARCDGLVAASTGPLHLAAAFGRRAVGIYAPMRPIFPARWKPLGPRSTYLVLDKNCSDCRKTMDCACIRSIRPEDVAEKLANPHL